MTDVSVVVPYRGDNGGPRDQAWDYVQRWWAEHHPQWQLVAGYLPDGPWVKALAVANGLQDATGGVLVVSDADVLCPGVGWAVQAVSAGQAPWAVPHLRVQRFTEDATSRLLAGGPLPDDLGPHRSAGPGIQESYRGMVGGGMVVLPRSLYERVPLDPRFEGYGQEDSALGIALTTIAGPPYRGHFPLWHLWHPPQSRMTRAVGSEASLALHNRYRQAKGSPDLMNALIAEATI